MVLDLFVLLQSSRVGAKMFSMFRLYCALLVLLGVTAGSPLIDEIDKRQASCSSPTTQHLSAPPYENYFYSDCDCASQVVVTSPLASSNLTLIGPRLLVCERWIWIN